MSHPSAFNFVSSIEIYSYTDAKASFNHMSLHHSVVTRFPNHCVKKNDKYVGLALRA